MHALTVKMIYEGERAKVVVLYSSNTEVLNRKEHAANFNFSFEVPSVRVAFIVTERALDGNEREYFNVDVARMMMIGRCFHVMSKNPASH